MELKDAKILLEKYFEGNTSEEEETRLTDFFHSEDIPSELAVYKEFFVATNELAEIKEEGFDNEIMDQILEYEYREKNKFRWLWQTVSSVAAILLLALLVVNYNQNNHFKDTYDDPDIAYHEASKIVQYMAGKYQQGVKQLEPIAKLDKATAPLQSGLRMVNKGFDEMRELEEVNEKIKK